MRVGVIGGGLMGSGIAEVCARSGVDVTVVEADDERAERARAAIERSLGRAVKSGKLDEDGKAAALERLAVTSVFEDLEGVDAAIEAVIENEELKRGIFRRLDELLPDAQFLASNTSSVPIMKLGAETKHPGPRARHALLQPGAGAAAGRARDVDHDRARDRRRRARVRRRTRSASSASTPRTAPGFVVNALLIPYLLSAIRMYESGFASKEDIDQGMVLGCAHPMGPLHLSDLIGLDTLLAVSESLYDEFRDPASVAPALLNRMVEAGLLGRKSGRGFYDYSKK